MIIQCEKLRHLKQGASKNVHPKVPWELQNGGLQGPRRSRTPASSPVMSPSSSPVVTAVCSHPLTSSAPDSCLLLAARCSMISNCRGGNIYSLLAFHGAEIAVGTRPFNPGLGTAWWHQCPIPGAAWTVLSAHRPVPPSGANSHPCPMLWSPSHPR